MTKNLFFLKINNDISIFFVIPVFNKSLYLDSVINSVKNQKGNFKKEYIFINDGSTDNSLNILKDKTKNLRNCKILTQKTKDQRCYECRNKISKNEIYKIS